jgi:hypothetical protein
MPHSLIKSDSKFYYLPSGSSEFLLFILSAGVVLTEQLLPAQQPTFKTAIKLNSIPRITNEIFLVTSPCTITANPNITRSTLGKFHPLKIIFILL